MKEGTNTGYRVLARKYRPERFSELIGQEALVRTLSNAIKLGRLAHAFVLTGVRGVGKTSTARLLARGLNCIGADGKGEATLEPCGKCEPCRAIAEGRHVDVLEIDAASHTGVDDARDIIEGVGYRPVSARFKIYVIDEVHMMSKNAFNALLKTLEEPPDAVKFIFATTEIRKVPVTILSRCQRFDLRRVSTETLAKHLERICKAEKIDAKDEAIAAIARAAEGSVRDSLSLLDQAAAMSADSISVENIEGMLGRPGRATSVAILRAVIDTNSEAALGALGEALVNGAEPEMVVGDLMELVHHASLKAAGGVMDTLLESEKQAVDAFAAAGVARLGRLWQMLIKGHGEVATAPRPAAAVQMLLIRLAHVASLPTPGEIVKRLAGDEAGADASAPKSGAGDKTDAKSGNGADAVHSEKAGDDTRAGDDAARDGVTQGAGTRAMTEAAPPAPSAEPPAAPPPAPEPTPEHASAATPEHAHTDAPVNAGGQQQSPYVSMGHGQMQAGERAGGAVALAARPDPDHMPEPDAMTRARDDTNTAPVDAAPAVDAPQSLLEIHELAKKHRESVLAAQIHEHVRPVSIRPDSGLFEISLAGDAPLDFLGNLTRQLHEWTGRRWVVSVVETSDKRTLKEWKAELEQERKQKVLGDPLLQKIMQTFPGSEVISIKESITANE